MGFFDKAKGNAVKGIGSAAAIGVGGGNVPASGYYEGTVVGALKHKNGSFQLEVMHNNMDKPSRGPFMNNPLTTKAGDKPQYAERDADKLGALVFMLGDKVQAILAKKGVNLEDPIVAGGAIIDLLSDGRFFASGPGAGAKVTIQWRFAPEGAKQAKKPSEKQWSEIVAVLPIDQLDDRIANGPHVEDFPLPTVNHRAVNDGDDGDKPRGDYSSYTGRTQPTSSAGSGGSSAAEDEEIPF